MDGRTIVMNEEKSQKTEQVKKTASKADFEEAYKKLCQEMGYTIAVSPVWIARDDGTFSLVVQTSVQEIGR